MPLPAQARGVGIGGSRPRLALLRDEALQLCVIFVSLSLPPRRINRASTSAAPPGVAQSSANGAKCLIYGKYYNTYYRGGPVVADGYDSCALGKNDSLAAYSREANAPLCYFFTLMALASTDQVLQATQQWLKPLIHVLLSCGITWREFATLARATYVEVATDNFGKRGRPDERLAYGHPYRAGAQRGTQAAATPGRAAQHVGGLCHKSVPGPVRLASRCGFPRQAGAAGATAHERQRQDFHGPDRALWRHRCQAVHLVERADCRGSGPCAR